jgi:hypothetical protein
MAVVFAESPLTGWMYVRSGESFCVKFLETAPLTSRQITEEFKLSMSEVKKISSRAGLNFNSKAKMNDMIPLMQKFWGDILSCSEVHADELAEDELKLLQKMVSKQDLIAKALTYGITHIKINKKVKQTAHCTVDEIKRVIKLKEKTTIVSLIHADPDTDQDADDEVSLPEVEDMAFVDKLSTSLPKPTMRSEPSHKMMPPDFEQLMGEYVRKHRAASVIQKAFRAAIKSKEATQVFVKALDGKTFALQVKSQDTVLLLKAMVQGVTKVPHGEQRLVFEGEQLEDTDKVLDLVCPDGTIHMSLRLRAGGKRALSIPAKDSKGQQRDEVLKNLKTQLDQTMLLMKTDNTTSLIDALESQVAKSREMLAKDDEKVMEVIMKSLSKDTLKKVSIFSSNDVSVRTMSISKILFSKELDIIGKMESQIEHAHKVMHLLATQAIVTSYQKETTISWKQMEADLMNALSRTDDQSTSSCVVA